MVDQRCVCGEMIDPFLTLGMMILNGICLSRVKQNRDFCKINSMQTEYIFSMKTQFLVILAV